MSIILAGHEIDLLVFDFDGVMTDNRVLLGEDGKESVFVSRADGLGISLLREMKLEMLILSTEVNPVVSERARKIKVRCIQGVSSKEDALKDYCHLCGVSMDKVAFVGNDINDRNAMQLAMLSIVPADAHPVVREDADIVLASKGGYGVVRELADMIIKENA